MGAASTSTDDSGCVSDRHAFEDAVQQLEEDLKRLPGAMPVKQVGIAATIL
jgi:hypothetical protein